MDYHVHVHTFMKLVENVCSKPFTASGLNKKR